MLHGKGNHSTKECCMYQNQAKKMKTTYDVQTPDDCCQLKKKQELKPIIAEKVSKALAAEEKKRLRKKCKVSQELDQFEQLSISNMSQMDASSNNHLDSE